MEATVDNELSMLYRKNISWKVGYYFCSWNLQNLFGRERDSVFQPLREKQILSLKWSYPYWPLFFVRFLLILRLDREPQESDPEL